MTLSALAMTWLGFVLLSELDAIPAMADPMESAARSGEIQLGGQDMGQAPSTGARLGALLSLEEIVKLRDPFKRPNMRNENISPQTDLERYQAESFKLLGVTTGPKKARALLLAPDGKTYLAYEKAKIGVRGGEILRIMPSSIQIREKVINIIGQQEVSDILIELQKAVAQKIDLPTEDAAALGKPAPFKAKKEENLGSSLEPSAVGEGKRSEDVPK